MISDRTPEAVLDLPRPRWLQLRWIVGAQVLLSILWIVLVPIAPVSDSNVYEIFARNIAAGHGYAWEPGRPSVYWAPGTAFLYAPFYLLGDTPYLAIAAFNLVLRVGLTVLIATVGRTLFGPTIGLTAAALHALWPSQIQFTTVIASEIPFATLLAAAVAVWLRKPHGVLPAAAYGGVLLGLASIVRPTALLIPIVLLISDVIRSRSIRSPMTATAVTFLLMAVTIAPWTIRNVRTFDTFVLISTNGGANLWMGNNPDTDGGYMPLPDRVDGLSEIDREEVLKQEAIDYIRSDPAAFATRTIVKLVRLHERETIGVAWNEEGLRSRYGEWILTPMKIVAQAYWIPMLGLGLLGAIIVIRREGLLPGLAHPTVILWGYFASVHAVIVIQDRYHFPSIPFIAILGAVAVSFIVHRVRLGRRSADADQHDDAQAAAD